MSDQNQGQSETAGIKPGDVLNGIFQVKKFLARGGMGEVFEGTNVNTDERVAIKVVLPHLAADAKVQEMFKREARTLTRLSHPSLVQYRVLAQEPDRGILYIVTDFIEGDNLQNVISSLGATPTEIGQLTRKLADGLRAAHQLGAVHRDLSPDNIILEKGRLERPRIIDFGIAKDLDASQATIIGDGFAGKLGFVAPEQLGDFGRKVGPWTDVYSLGLVILSIIRGKNVDMGTSLAEAIDRRRQPMDLMGVPGDLRPLLQAMLVANPEGRLQSMDEVINVIDRANYQHTLFMMPQTTFEPGEAVSAAIAASTPAAPTQIPATAPVSHEPTMVPQPAAAPPPPPPSPPAAPSYAPPPGRNKMPLIAGGALAVIALAAGGWYFLGPGGGGGGSLLGGGPDVAAVQTALNAVPCTWLTAEAGNGGMVSLTGAARDDMAVKAAVSQAGGGENADTTRIAPLEPSACQLLDALGSVRGNRQRITAVQTEYEMTMNGAPSYQGQPGTTINFKLALGDSSLPFTVFGITPSGKVEVDEFDKTPLLNRDLIKLREQAGYVEVQQNDSYRIKIDMDTQGWVGVLLVSGMSPSETGWLTTDRERLGANWPQNFKQWAQSKGVQAEMAWIHVVDNVPN